MSQPFNLESEETWQRRVRWFGFGAVILFGAAFVFFSAIHPRFELLDDFVSKLGARGQPNALGWNLIGFGLVGLLLASFGWGYGRLIGDRWVGVLFAGFGLGFAATGVPVEMENPTAVGSKFHIVAICLALAFWLIGLARLAGAAFVPPIERRIANVAATLLVLPMIGFAVGAWSMTVTHRLVFLVVFSWVGLAALRSRRLFEMKQRQ